MVVSQREDHALERARTVAEAVRGVAAELRLTDVADLVAFIRLERFGDIQDIVESSVELYFKHGTLTYGMGADYELGWDGQPIIKLDLEFRHRDVSALFSLCLEDAHASIDVKSLAFEDDSVSADAEIQALAAALADARLGRAAERAHS
jgi:hypothetical protein